MKICIFLACTSNLLFAAANVIIGINKYAKLTNDFVFKVYVDNIEEIHNEELKTIISLGRVEIVNYKFKELSKTLESTKNYAAIKSRFSDMYFAKFEIFNLIQFYDEVLYLDVDLLVINDINVLFEYINKRILIENIGNNSPYILAWRPGRDKFQDRLKIDGIKEQNTAPNAGVIYLQKRNLFASYNQINYLEVFKNLSQIVNTKTLDELTFGYLAILHNIPVINLPDRFNCAVGWNMSGDEVIIHSIGVNKFWNYAPFYHIFNEWKRNQKKYEELLELNKINISEYPYSLNKLELNMSGSSIFGSSLEQFIFFIYKYQFWTDILSKLNIHNNRIYQGQDYSRSVFKFFIKNVNSKIYYHLKIIDKSNLEIALVVPRDMINGDVTTFVESFKGNNLMVDIGSFIKVKTNSNIINLNVNLNNLINSTLDMLYIHYFKL